MDDGAHNPANAASAMAIVIFDDLMTVVLGASEVSHDLPSD